MKLLSITLTVLALSFISNPNYNKYHRLVNEANHQLYINNYEKASSYLTDAFEVNDQPYYHDIYKLILCNSKLNDRVNTSDLLERLVNEKNINPKLIKYQLGSLLTQKEIDFLEELDYKEKKSNLKSALLELIEYDQKIRDYSKCDSISNDDEASRCAYQLFAIRDSIDELNAKVFINIIKKYGIPSENNIGVYLDGLSSSYNQLFYILGIHFLQTESKNKIYDIYLKGFKAGKFHPELFGAIYDFMQDNARASFGKKLLNTTISIVDNKFYKRFIKYTDSNIDSINHNRISIGLDSFHIVQKQVLSDFVCKKKGKTIPIISFPRFEELPSGLVKEAFKIEGIKLESYELNTAIIKEECQCQNKQF